MIEPFTAHAGKAASLPFSNVDTDQIIPARFLTRSRSEGFAEYLFYDLRFDDAGRPTPGFVLDDPEHSQSSILLSGENFGCGSSREQAVWALVDAGFRVVIAPSFGDIFYNNSFKNGLLLIELPAETIGRIEESLRDGTDSIAIDLPAQRLSVAGGDSLDFAIDPYWKECLLKGMSELTLTLAHLQDIDAFEQRYRPAHDWQFSRPETSAHRNNAGLKG